MKADYCFYTRVIFTGLIFLSAFPVMSQESNMYIPLGGYDYIGLDSQAIHSPGAGSIFIGDNYTFFGTYRYNSFSENAPEGYPENFHSINVMVEAHKARHQ